MKVQTPDVRLPKLDGRHFVKALRDLSASDVTEIKKRTVSGKDVDLQPFKPYSKATQAYKMKKGVSTGDTPTLMDTGKMLRGVNSKPSKEEYVVRVTDHAQIGYKHQTGDGVPERKWFGADKDMQKKQKRVLQEALNKEMKPE